MDLNCRQQSSEFVLSILRELLDGGYTVVLAPSFLEEEIRYYETNLDKETPQDMARGILNCLRTARASGALDWDCLRKVRSESQDRLAGSRHFPWMAPGNARLVRLGTSADKSLPELQCSVHWVTRDYNGNVGFARTRSAAETQMVSGQAVVCNFDARLRLQQGDQTLFQRVYPQEAWRNSYSGSLELPAQKAVLRIVGDVGTGLKPKPVVPSQKSERKKPVEKK